MYFCYMKKHRIQSNDHKKYVKLSHMFQRIINNEYPICIQDISNYSCIWDMCLIFERLLRKHNKTDCLLAYDWVVG